MDIIYRLGQTVIKRNNLNNRNSVILTNKIGGYYMFSSDSSTKYQGAFLRSSNNMYKVIDSISLADFNEIEELLYDGVTAVCRRKNVVETHFMPHGFNSLSYELNKKTDIEIFLDVRPSYEYPQWNRFYQIIEENNKLIIRYSEESKPEVYIVISGYDSHEAKGEWLRRLYYDDRARQSEPYEIHVYKALRVHAKKIICSYSFDKDAAIKENDFVSKNIRNLIKKQKAAFSSIISKNKKILDNIESDNIKSAYMLSLWSLYSLASKVDSKKGIYAGLPWFFQFWSRDEATSLKALKLVDNEYAEEVQKRLINLVINSESEIRENNNIYTLDTAGWVAERSFSLRKADSYKPLYNYFISKFYTSDLLPSSPKQTWMDHLPREGYCIEWQAFKLLILSIIDKNKEKSFKEVVLKNFWNGLFLKDRENDATIRPNIFIAAYIYQNLLKDEYWIRCFDYSLKKLWLQWGGLSTIDKTDAFFIPEHTGENPISYHSGDSWFWINNLAGIVLNKIDSKRYLYNILKIVEASAHDILWLGALGHSSEVSSASDQKSQGCMMQAWSAAMFIELISEISSSKLI